MKIFVLLSRVPFPIEKGDKLRAFHQIRCLAKNNQIIVCCLSNMPIHPEALNVLNSFCDELHIIPIHKTGMVWNMIKVFFNGKPFQVGYFYRNSAQKKINTLLKNTNPDHIYCQLIRVSEYVKDALVPKTLDYQDVFSTGAKRQAETAPVWMRFLYLLEYKRLLKYEHNIFNKFDHKSIISQPDRDLLPHASRNEVAIIPNGVDQQYFYPIKTRKTHDLVFTGNMGYPPNIDAARYIALEIFPLVLKQFPNATLLIAGATPHPKVMALQTSNITVTGWLADIRECYASSSIFIAPMRIGTGLQNKLLEAMAMQLPCITSALANQALGAKENEEILVGTTAGNYAEHIISLMQNESMANDLAQRGYDFVSKTFSWENSTSMLEELFNTH